MRKLIIISLAIVVTSCKSQPESVADLDLNDFKQKISYALGADMGANFSNVPEKIFSQMDKKELEKGFYEYLTSEDKQSKDCQAVLQTALGSRQGIDTSEHSMKEISHCYGSIFGEMQRSSLVSKNALDQVNFNIVKMGFVSAIKKEDTLIPEEERKEMIINFNNDLNKTASNDFIDKKTGEFPDAVSDQGYIIVENDPSGGEVVDTTKEYKIKYTLTDIGGDTIISTVRDPESDDEFNSQIINTDDVVFPDVWSMAAKEMKVGGDYTIYAPYDLAFGEEGLSSPRSSGYIIQPFSAVVIHSKVLRQNARNTAIKKRGSKVLEDAKGQPNTVVDESGYVLTTLQEGTGKTVPAGSDVQAHYILTNSKGESVENSYQMAAQKKQPAPTFSLNSMVKGWSLAFQEMKKGGRYKLVLPPDLGYGEKGNQNILPYETLTFEIEVLDFGEEGSLVKQRPQQQGGQQQQLTKEQMEQLQKQMQQQGQQ